MNENMDKQTGERDDIAVLVRLAGKRQVVPPARAERVRTAARAGWQHEVRRRSRSRFMWTAAALAVAASLVLAVTSGLLPFKTPWGQESNAVVVQALTGEAWVRESANGTPASRRALRPGDQLGLGSEILTAETGRAALLLASGHSIRLDRSARIRLVGARSIALDRGAIYIDSGSDVPGNPVDVETSFGMVREIGTQFEVRLEPQTLLVRLREGSVEVREGGETHQVDAGEELALHGDGTVDRRSLSTHGTEWEWLAGVTPMLDLEGRTAQSFLNWVARERGLTVAFSDENVARSAAETVLRGTTRGLTLDQALDAVLPTCRLTYRIDDDLLVISAVQATATAG